MKKTTKVKINNVKGLHARVVAMVVHKVSKLQKKFHVQIYIYKNNKKISATALMPLVLLKIKQDEEILVEVVSEKDNEKDIDTVLKDISEYLSGNFNIVDEQSIKNIDNIIHNNTIAWEKIFNSLASGLMVTDENNIITLFNPMAEKILGIPANKLIGKKVYEVIPDTKSHIVRKSKVASLGIRKVINSTIIMLNHTPIIINGQIKGVATLFQDISKMEQITGELTEVKELKERFELILDSVQDGICVLNKEGYVTYANSSYANILKLDDEALIGENIKAISPDGLRRKVLISGKSERGKIIKKRNGVIIAADVSPIIVDGKINGVISVVKDLTQILNLSQNLNKAQAKAEYFEDELLRTKKPNKSFDKFIGNSGNVKDVLAIASKAAKSNSTVLIKGESGTGKEIIAEGIHFASNRSNGPFIRVNCAAMPTSLLESELFGHEKGAFTGAIKRKLGKFELANKGTIFLDEIGETDKSMQAKLLRVLQQREFQRVGGEDTIKVDVRIICATNRNLEGMVNKEQFREDLYYRLNVIPIILPSLKERKQDIPILIEHFIEKISNEMGGNVKGITNDALDCLIKYKWPGNVRELENLIERLITLSEGKYIDVEELPIYIKQENLQNIERNHIKNANEEKNNEVYMERENIKKNPQEEYIRDKEENIKNMIEDSEEILPLKEYEKIVIEKALKKYGSFNAAAKVLGVTHKTVASKARKYGISKVVSWEKTH